MEDSLLNGDKVVYCGTIVYTFIGLDPEDSSYGLCQHPTAHEDYEPTRPFRIDRIHLSRLKKK